VDARAPVELPDASTPPTLATVETDAGAPATDLDAGTIVEAGASTPETPGCVPEAGADEPDDSFVDSNCDGIDGDVASAVFVAPSGNDGADGTMTSPLRSLKHAIDVATAAGKSVYLCDGEYAEAVDLESGGVSLYGGYACDRGWMRERDRATVKPKSGVPFTVKNTTAPMVVDRLAFRAVDGTSDGASVVAATVVGAKQVRFRNALFVAGNATTGASGTPLPDPLWVRQAPAADAVALPDVEDCRTLANVKSMVFGGPDCLQFSAGAAGAGRLCPNGDSIAGGWGGRGGNWITDFGQYGAPGADGIPSSGTAHDGAPGVNGDPGAVSTAGFGDIQAGVYVASNDGKDGSYGARGQSGRGGDGGDGPVGNGAPDWSFWPGGGGGQGGYPGCGGHGGHRGSAGGASLGLIVVNSVVLLEQSTVQTGRGGDGGTGSDGQSGQQGGPGGKGARAAAATLPETDGRGSDGGNGGDGGSGGAGGPGGGGPSIAIVWTGTAPSIASVTYELGTPGYGGTSSGVNGPNGVGGESVSLDQIRSAGQ
jgi:hypothetical protein